MQNTKLIITDLDFTMLHTDKSISNYSREIFAKCSDYGIHTAVATARYKLSAQAFTDILKPDYLITSEGSLIYHGEELIFDCGFDIDTTNRLISDLLSASISNQLTVATKHAILRNTNFHADSLIMKKGIYYDFQTPLKEEGYKLVTQLPDPDTAYRIADKYKECKVINYREENRYSFIHKDAGKVQGIKALTRYLGIDLAEVMAFGDDVHDIEMLKQCGYGVAVMNAVEEVLQVADYVTDSNDEDGVAGFIEKNLLSKRMLE